MASKKKKNIKTGASLHPKNRHQGRYDLEALAKDESRAEEIYC